MEGLLREEVPGPQIIPHPSCSPPESSRIQCDYQGVQDPLQEVPAFPPEARHPSWTKRFVQKHHDTSRNFGQAAVGVDEVEVEVPEDAPEEEAADEDMGDEEAPPDPEADPEAGADAAEPEPEEEEEPAEEEDEDMD